MKEFKNCIFDFGNVLVKYDPHLLFDPYFGSAELTDRFHETVLTEEWYNAFDRGDDYMGVIRELQRLHPEYAEPIGMYDSDYQKTVGGEIPGMYELLTRLKAQGKHLYGLTNWSYKVLEVMENHEIFKLLDGTVMSFREHVLKPWPEIYKLLLDRYGLKAEESVFVDDRPKNVATAVSLGMQGIVFRNAEEFEKIIFG